MSRQEEDKALLRMFKQEIQAAFWVRTKDTKIVVGMRIAFKDGAMIILEAHDEVKVQLIEPIRRDNKGTRK